MKILADGFEVSARSYYFLLDWNERNEWRYIVSEFGRNALSELTRIQYKQLFRHAFKNELTKL